VTAVTTGAQPVDEAALRGLLAQVDRRRSARALIVTATPEWDGPETLDTEAGPVRVVTGSSVLAVRAALAEHAEEFLAVLTPFGMAELGEEVAARAWHGRALRPSPRDAVKALFKVDQVDPRLRGERWLVDLLVRVAPPLGYRQPRSQLLDRPTAWQTLYRYGLGLDADDPTTAHLLDWAASVAASLALARVDADDRAAIGAHLAGVAGPAAVPLLELVAGGRGGGALAVGLVIDALWPESDPVARVLLAERHLGRRALTDGEAAGWARAAVEVVRREGLDSDRVQEALAHASDVLADVDAGGSADSGVLGVGFERRLARLGAALSDVLDSSGSPGTLRAAERAFEAVLAHLRAEHEPGRVSRAEAALRLARRAMGERSIPGRASGLAVLARHYVAEGAWVDAARHRLAEGETVPELACVFDRLLTAVDGERAERDRTFAGALAAEAADAPTPPPDLQSGRPLPIEAVLGTVVAPVAQSQPVLLLVLDGLSHGAAIGMLDALRREGWQPHGPGGRDLPPVVAALPTVTVVSRASLLCGRLTSGNQKVERAGFTGSAVLRDAAGGQAPVLFHKSDLRTAGGEFAPTVQETVADPEQRVVGIVVNGVDDHLDKGSQLRLADGLEGVPVLRPILAAATEARRAVVLASDHGHVLGAHQRVVAAAGAGERYRPTGTPPARDEVEFAGARVLENDHRAVLAAEDGVRYTPVAKHGYHGGATPAEALCPLAVLLPGGVALDGWEPLPVAAPAWWDPASAPVAVDLPVPALDSTGRAPEPAARPGPAGRAAEAQPSLLDELRAPQVVTPAWLTALLASPRLAEQRRLAGRAALDDDDLAALLRVLVASGGRASSAALQRTLGLAPSRLRGKLQAARHLLDVEGYAVLRVESDGTAILNLDHLATQFEIPRPEAAP
jgi:hypothetical protein